jgi:hypothetical protein
LPFTIKWSAFTPSAASFLETGFALTFTFGLALDFTAGFATFFGALRFSLLSLPPSLHPFLKPY